MENSWILLNTYPKSNDGQLVIAVEHKYLKDESYRGVKTYTGKRASLSNYIFMEFDEHYASGSGLELMQGFVSGIVNRRSFRTNTYDDLQTTGITTAVCASTENGNVAHL